MANKFFRLTVLLLVSALLLVILAACGQTATTSEAEIAVPTTTSELFSDAPTRAPYTRATATPAPTATASAALLPVATLPPLRELPTIEPRPTIVYTYPPGPDMDITEGEATPEAITNWLARFRSPQLQETSASENIGQVYVNLGRKYGINPAYAAAFFTKESTCGTNGSNLAAFNFGNIRWTPGYNTLDKVWRAYSNWTEGMEDWFKLIKTEYVNRGLRTVDQIVPVYAPPFENDSSLYARQIKEWTAIILGK